MAPLRVCYNVWPIQKNDWKEFQHIKVNVIHGKNKETALYDLTADIYCINPEGLDWLCQTPERIAFIKENFDILIVDECFVGETLVSTPHGKVRIDSLSVEDEVLTSAGVRRVKSNTCRKAQALVNLVLSTGEHIRCTPNHPFFTDVGWLCAGDLDGRIIHRRSLPDLQCGVSSSKQQSKQDKEAWTTSEMLLKILRSEADAPTTSSHEKDGFSNGERTGRSSKLEQGSVLERRSKEEAIRNWKEKQRPVSEDSSWEWNWNDGMRIFASDSPPCEFRMELPGSVGDEARRISYELQARLCGSRGKDRDRDRRTVAQESDSPINGQEKRGEIKGVRVVRVENIKQDNLPDVWSLEVEGCPHYFVGDGEYLVHNSTKFKHTNTKRFKLLRKFIKYFKRRYILTGTIAPNGLMDLFGQIYILDEGASLGSYITHYKSKYFYPVDYMGYNLAPHPWAKDAIAAKIAPLTLVLTGKEDLDLPELFPPHDILVDLPSSARARYAQMEATMIASLENDEVVAANAAVASSKCRQIANGGIYLNSLDGTYEDLHDAKLSALEDLIEELSGESLLVVYEFGFDLEKLQARFPQMVRLTSGNPRKDAEEIAKFKAGITNLACGQFSSISLGIDGLQNSCHHICMFGLTWNLQDYIQTIDRVHRSGQQFDVTLHRIIAKDTVDERVLSVLNSKNATQEGFLSVLKGMRP